MHRDIKTNPMESSAISALTESTAKTKPKAVLPEALPGLGDAGLGPTRDQLNLENGVGAIATVQETSEIWKGVDDTIKSFDFDEYMDEMGGIVDRGDRGNGVFGSRTNIQGAESNVRRLGKCIGEEISVTNEFG
jgi:hypothetical protein